MGVMGDTPMASLNLLRPTWHLEGLLGCPRTEGIWRASCGQWCRPSQIFHWHRADYPGRKQEYLVVAGWKGHGSNCNLFSWQFWMVSRMTAQYWSLKASVANGNLTLASANGGDKPHDVNVQHSFLQLTPESEQPLLPADFCQESPNQFHQLPIIQKKITAFSIDLRHGINILVVVDQFAFIVAEFDSFVPGPRTW